MALKASDVTFKTRVYPRVCACMCVCATLYISVEHCVRMVLTVEERPSSTRLSRWVWVSISISSLVCSSVLLSIRAKHLQEHRYTVMHLSATKMSTAFRRNRAASSGWRSQRCRPVRFKQKKKHSDVNSKGFIKSQFDLLICLYLSRNWRTKSSNSAEAKHRSFSIWGGQTERIG